MKPDYSKYIFDTFYKPGGGLLKVFLKDGRELEGRFIGYFHGDNESDEPFIIKWHFVIADNPEIIPKEPALKPINNPEIIIMNRDIDKVEFK